MRSAVPNQRIRRRDADHDDEEQPKETVVVQAANRTADAAVPDVSQPAPTDANADGAQQQPQPADVQPLPEHMRKKSRRSPRFRSPLDVLAKVELQLVLQFLDTKSKLMAARCSRQLLHAADHPFAWRGPPVAVSSFGQPQLGSRIRQSLLRQAPIALTLSSDLPVAEVAVIPNLRELAVLHNRRADLVLQLLALPSLQGLQVLRGPCRLPLSALQLLPTLPALHTLERWVWDSSADWRWLPAKPALTDLSITCVFESFPPPLVDAIGRCAKLGSLRLRRLTLKAGVFGRLCCTPSMRRLRQLTLAHFPAPGGANSAQYGEGFGALAGLQSLCLDVVYGVDTLLPHLAHAPALRALSVLCHPSHPNDVGTHKSTLPSRETLRQLLTAAPLLEVRLAVAASFDEWRNHWLYQSAPTSAADREQIDDQWRELQRMGAEMERVTIVNDPASA